MLMLPRCFFVAVDFLEDFWVENESEDIVGLDLTASHQAPSVTGGWSSNMAQP